MLVFGVDIPLVEVVLIFMLIVFLLLIEVLVIIALLSRHMAKTKKLGDLVENLSETILAIKKKELEELDKIKR